MIDVHGFYPDTTPNQSLFKLADTLNENAKYNREQGYRQQKDKEADDYKKYQVLKEATPDPLSIATNNTTADEWLNHETTRIQNEINSDPKLFKLPPTELYGEIQKRWLPLLQTASKLKTGLSQIDLGVKQSGTENKNISNDKLTAEAKTRFINDIMPIDPSTGQRNYNVSNYKPDVDYVGNILNSSDRWKFLDPKASVSGLIDKIEKTKQLPVNYWKRLPDGSILPYSGHISSFNNPTANPDETGKLPNSISPSWETPFDTGVVEDASGGKSQEKLLNQEIYNQYFGGDDGMDVLWNTHKMQTGFVPKNSAEEEKAKRAFAYGILKQHDPSVIPNQHPIDVPRTSNRTNINMPGSTPFRDVHKDVVETLGDKESAEFRRLKPDSQTTILGYLKNSYPVESYDATNVQIEKQDGQYYVVDPNKTESGGGHKRLLPLDEGALNIKGSASLGIKGKTAAANAAQKNTGNQNPTGKTYLYNGKSVSFDKIEKAAKQSGLSTDDYIKQFGIKQQ